MSDIPCRTRRSCVPPSARRKGTGAPGCSRGGRGAGKSLAGAAWLAGRARDVGRLALVGPTYADARKVMIEGPSGLRGLAAAFGPEGGRARYEPSRRWLVWPNGAAGFAFTAKDPDGLRGPRLHAAR